MNRYKWLIGIFVVAMGLLSSCQKDSGRYNRPLYPNIAFPSEVTTAFPKPKEGKKLPEVKFHIDNRKMRIWNQVPLPYQSHYDSVEIKIVANSTAIIRILNEQTKAVTLYTETRELQKIDMTGGKLKIMVETEGKSTLIYDFRLLTYGYDPNKYTWKKEEAKAPIPAIRSQYFEYNEVGYWLGTLADGNSYLYRFTPATISFEEVASAKLPRDLMPASITKDSSNTVWALTTDGKLFKTKNLNNWEQHNTDNVALTQLVGETTMLNGQLLFSAIGRSATDDTYHSYSITSEGVSEGEALPEGFPVKEAFVHMQKQNNTSSATLYGGVTSKGTAATKSFFLSGGARWGETPYQKKSVLPKEGGLFLRTGLPNELFVVGGTYPDGKTTNTIMKSNDKGITWAKLPEQNLPDGAFVARHHASGVALGSNAALQIYIIGGIISGEPSQEIWHGFLDTTGGIINSYE